MVSERKIRNPIFLALEYENMIKKREVSSKAELARKLGISRARVTQMMNLFKPKLSGFFRSETQETAANRAVGTFFRCRRICQYVETKKCETSDAAKVFKSQQKRIAQFRLR